MPKLTLIAAQSLDGFITHHDTPGTSFCSPEDQAAFIGFLKQFDSLIMGRPTYELSRNAIRNAKATHRLRKIWTRHPENWQHDTIPNSIEFTNAAPQEILTELKQRNTQNTALLGGTETYTSFLQANLVDELWLTLEPRLFGSGKKLATGTLDTTFTHTETQHLSPNTLLLKYKKA